ncbi:MAG: hypothetical protein ACI4TE_03905 [Alphaproteobacteria bacterium]
MFTGYQKDKNGALHIVAVSEDIDALQKNSVLTFEKIEETDERYVLFDGNYIKQSEFNVNEIVRRNRFEKYKQETDMVLLDKLDSVSDLADLMAAVKDWQNAKKKIKAEYPYT